MHNIIELVKEENVGAFREAVRSELNRRLERAYAALEPEAVSGLGLKYHSPMQEDFEVVSEEVIDIDQIRESIAEEAGYEDGEVISEEVVDIDAIRESLSEEDMKPACDPCPDEDEKDEIDDEKEEFRAAGTKHRRRHGDPEEDEVLTERE